MDAIQMFYAALYIVDGHQSPVLITFLQQGEGAKKS